MKKLVSILFSFLFLTACSTPLKLAEQDNEKSFTVPVGKKIIITLPENPTTGYVWQFFVSPDGQSVIKDIHENYISPQTGLLGSSGIKEYSFVTKHQGTLTIQAAYQRPWEKNKKSAKNITYTIIVFD